MLRWSLGGRWPRNASRPIDGRNALLAYSFLAAFKVKSPAISSGALATCFVLASLHRGRSAAKRNFVTYYRLAVILEFTFFAGAKNLVRLQITMIFYMLLYCLCMLFSSNGNFKRKGVRRQSRCVIRRTIVADAQLVAIGQRSARISQQYNS